MAYICANFCRCSMPPSNVMTQDWTILHFPSYKRSLKRPAKNGLRDCNWTRTHNHLVHKQTLDHLAKLASLAKCSSVCLWTKRLWVRVQLQSLKLQISRLLPWQEYWFTLKGVRDMIITDSQKWIKCCVKVTIRQFLLQKFLFIVRFSKRCLKNLHRSFLWKINSNGVIYGFCEISLECSILMFWLEQP